MSQQHQKQIKRAFEKGKLEQKKEELSFMKECGINSFKNIEEADSSGFEKEFRRFKQLQKEIRGMKQLQKEIGGNEK